ncbi:hypothetical protein ACWCQW_18040 [Streptomyces mirabilis]
MALVIALLCGTIGALVAFIVWRHFNADTVKALAYAGSTFLGVTYLVKAVEEKLNLL